MAKLGKVEVSDSKDYLEKGFKELVDAIQSQKENIKTESDNLLNESLKNNLRAEVEAVDNGATGFISTIPLNPFKIPTKTECEVYDFCVRAINNEKVSCDKNIPLSNFEADSIMRYVDQKNKRI
ncbi:MAG: hypothetical protein HRT37_05465 [Alteromonadaceae bacterium]|nr:hypothetical protein [Alteromonadaceae bacterium]